MSGEEYKDIKSKRGSNSKDLKSQRHASLHAPMEDGPNDKDEVLILYVTNRTRDASVARRADKLRAKRALAKMGGELRRIPAERQDLFETSDRAEWEKRIRCDAAEIPSDEVSADVDPTEAPPTRRLRADEIEATRGNKSHGTHPVNAKTRTIVPG